MISPFRLSLFAIALTAAAALWVVPEIHAGSGQVIRMPPRGARNTTGLVVQIDTQWVDACGYRDVRIHVATDRGVPAPAERNLRIEFSPYSYANKDSFVVQQSVTLPQGATRVTEHLLVPQNQPWDEIATRVYDGGRLSRQLSAVTPVNNRSGDDWSEAVAAILVIDADAPPLLAREKKLAAFSRNSASLPVENKLTDVRGLAQLVSRNQFAGGGKAPRDLDLLVRVATTSRLELVPPGDLPPRWVGLSCFDLIVIDLADLQQMPTGNKPQFQTLLDWASAGGNLLVFGLGDKYERLHELETLLLLSPRTTDGDDTQAGWKPADPRHFNDRATARFQAMQSGYDGYESGAGVEYELSDKPVIVASTRQAFRTTGREKFLLRPLALGNVVAMASSDPFPGSTTEWSWVLNAIGENRAMWYRRHGLSLRRENDDFWNFLVPNTGKAPVIAFCVLITLFAICIGPVNYFLLARQRRLYLLLATIPIGAALATFGLLAYALIADGLGTQARVRSYTHLDQSTGRAASWSRQSYYAGIAPSRGLVFPEDTAVYTVEQFPHSEYDRSAPPRRTLVWDDGQRLRRGYSASRITSQFLAIRAGESSLSLQLDGRTSPAGARNRLGGEIRLLVLRDAAGKFFTARDAADGERFSLAPASFFDAKTQLHRILLDNRPEKPEGLNAKQFANRRRGSYRWSMLDGALADAHCATSLMEDRIRAIENAQEKDFAPASYVAILAASPEAPLGARAREVGSFHVIQGKF